MHPQLPPLPAVPVCEPASRGISTRTQILLGACGCASAATFLFLVDPSQHAVYPQCALYNLTGMYCAGCGATRAAYALLHGRVFDAVHDNVLFVMSLPVLAWWLWSYLSRTWRMNAWPKPNVAAQTVTLRGVTMFALIIIFMIVRNIPGAPFDWLRPLHS